MCLPRNIPIALLLGRLLLSVSSCLNEYWKLSSRILRQDGRVTETPLFDIQVFREMMENAVLKVKILQLECQSQSTMLSQQSAHLKDT
jgi:hypothetical protein